MLRGKLYTITNNNTASSSMIRFEDFKQSTQTNPTLASIEVIDALNDPESGSGTLYINAYANHIKPVTPTVTIDHTGNVGIGVLLPQSKLDIDGDIQSTGVLSIAGHSNVQTSIDSKQAVLTSSSDITTGEITAHDALYLRSSDHGVARNPNRSTLTNDEDVAVFTAGESGRVGLVTGGGTGLVIEPSGDTIIENNATVKGDLTTEAVAATNVVVSGTVALDRLEFPDNTFLTSVPSWSGVNFVPIYFTTININTAWKELTKVAVREADSALQGVLLATSGTGSTSYEARVVNTSTNATVGQASFTAYGNVQIPVTVTQTQGSSVVYSLSIQLRRLSGTRFPAGVQGYVYSNQ